MLNMGLSLGLAVVLAAVSVFLPTEAFALTVKTVCVAIAFAPAVL